MTLTRYILGQLMRVKATGQTGRITAFQVGVGASRYTLEGIPGWHEQEALEPVY